MQLQAGRLVAASAPMKSKVEFWVVWIVWLGWPDTTGTTIRVIAIATAIAAQSLRGRTLD